jgi:hypothetical protein
VTVFSADHNAFRLEWTQKLEKVVQNNTIIIPPNFFTRKQEKLFIFEYVLLNILSFAKGEKKRSRKVLLNRMYNNKNIPKRSYPTLPAKEINRSEVK